MNPRIRFPTKLNLLYFRSPILVFTRHLKLKYSKSFVPADSVSSVPTIYTRHIKYNPPIVIIPKQTTLCVTQ